MTRRFENCQDAVGNPIDKSDGIDSSDFFNQMFTAQFGIWMSFTGMQFFFMKCQFKIKYDIWPKPASSKT